MVKIKVFISTSSAAFSIEFTTKMNGYFIASSIGSQAKILYLVSATNCKGRWRSWEGEQNDKLSKINIRFYWLQSKVSKNRPWSRTQWKAQFNNLVQKTKHLTVLRQRQLLTKQTTFISWPSDMADDHVGLSTVETSQSLSRPNYHHVSLSPGTGTCSAWRVSVRYRITQHTRRATSWNYCCPTTAIARTCRHAVGTPGHLTWVPKERHLGWPRVLAMSAVLAGFDWQWYDMIPLRLWCQCFFTSIRC